MDSQKLMQQSKLQEQLLNKNEEYENQRPSEEGINTQLGVQKNVLLNGMNVSAKQDISSQALQEIQSIGKQASRMNEGEIADKSVLYNSMELIENMDLQQKGRWIRQIKACPEFANRDGKGDIGELLDLFIHVLTNETRLDKKSKLTLQKLLNQKLLFFEEKYSSNESRQLVQNLKNLVADTYVQEDRLQENVQGAQERRVIKDKVSKLNQNKTAFFERIDTNPLYDEAEKLVRKIEYYRTYEMEVYGLRMNQDDVDLELYKIRYSRELNKLEKELSDYQAQRVALNREIAGIKEKLLHMQEDDPKYNEQVSRLEQLQQIIEDRNILMKKNLFALDQKKESSHNREVDKTLDVVQVEAVRELDRWMLEHATDEYKDKSFMAQIMGCTVRERLAMYLCVEMDGDALDDGALLFSQANYLPNKEKICKHMYGHSFLRSWGLKRVHWSKMRRAYEFVTKKSDTIEEMAKWNAEVQQAKRQNQNAQYNRQDGLDTELLKEKTEHKESINFAKKFNEQEIQYNVCSYGIAVLKSIEKLKDGQENKEAIKQELKMQVNRLRALVDRGTELAQDKGYKKHWGRFQNVVNILGEINSYYGMASYTAAGTRFLKVYDEKSWIGQGVDGADFTAIYGGLAINLFKCIKGTVDLSDKWLDSSASANFKGVLGSIQALNGYTSAIDMAVTTPLKFGTWAGGYRNYRKSLANTMKERVDKGLPANEFDLTNRLTYYQMIGSAMTVGTAAIDAFNIYRAQKASGTIKEQVRNRQLKDNRVDEAYRKANYKNAIANLTTRLNVRKGLTTTVNIISNMSGYMKYFIPLTTIGLITSGANIAISVLAAGVDKWLKKRSDYRTVDDFIDLKTMANEYHSAHNDVDVTDEKFLRNLRKNAMLQLGFANTKTLFAHVANKLGTMIHDVLNHAQRGNAEELQEVSPIVQIVKALGLRVNLIKHTIPTAKQIAAKLSA